MLAKCIAPGSAEPVSYRSPTVTLQYHSNFGRDVATQYFPSLRLRLGRGSCSSENWRDCNLLLVLGRFSHILLPTVASRWNEPRSLELGARKQGDHGSHQPGTIEPGYDTIESSHGTKEPGRVIMVRAPGGLPLLIASTCCARSVSEHSLNYHWQVLERLIPAPQSNRLALSNFLDLCTILQVGNISSKTANIFSPSHHLFGPNPIQPCSLIPSPSESTPVNHIRAALDGYRGIQRCLGTGEVLVSVPGPRYKEG